MLRRSHTTLIGALRRTLLATLPQQVDASVRATRCLVIATRAPVRSSAAVRASIAP